MFKKFIGIVTSRGAMATIAIASIAIAVYSTFIYQKAPAITYYVSSIADVYDVHEKIDELEILYSGENLSKSSQTLKLLSFKIVNTGNDLVRIADYHDASPFGFEIQEGKILDVKRISSSDDYIEKFLVINKSDKKATLMPFIFDPGEHIEFKVLVISKINEKTTIKPIGKIAGIKKFEVVENNKSNSVTSVKDILLPNEAWWVLASRLVAYGFVSIFGTVALLVFAGVISDSFYSLKAKKYKIAREETIAEYTKIRDIRQADRAVIDIYLSSSTSSVKMLERDLNSIKKKNQLVRVLEEHIDKDDLERVYERYDYITFDKKELIKRGLVREKDFLLEFKPDLLRATQDLLEFLEDK